MLETNQFYHIYNHANGSDNLFRADENYRFFLSKVLIHVCPVADIFAYCLLPNHFHFLVKIKPDDVFLTFPKFLTLGQFSTEEEYYNLQTFISKQFSNLFSSYTQAYNKVYRRRGSLFLKNFKHLEITNESYFKNIVHYIHANPVHHGFVKNMDEWKWSSYQTILSNKNTYIQKEAVITWFGDIKHYLTFHQQKIDLKLVPILEN